MGGNDDGVISAADGVWSQLRVWQDQDVDGVVDEGEFRSLSELSSRSPGAMLLHAIPTDRRDISRRPLSRTRTPTGVMPNWRDLLLRRMAASSSPEAGDLFSSREKNVHETWSPRFPRWTQRSTVTTAPNTRRRCLMPATRPSVNCLWSKPRIDQG